MEREKLNEAAKQDAVNTVIGDPYERGNYEMGFVSGAEWLMGQPLSERLTDEEKEKLTPANRYVLETIFGKKKCLKANEESLPPNTEETD